MDSVRIFSSVARLAVMVAMVPESKVSWTLATSVTSEWTAAPNAVICRGRGRGRRGPPGRPRAARHGPGRGRRACGRPPPRRRAGDVRRQSSEPLLVLERGHAAAGRATDPAPRGRDELDEPSDVGVRGN